MLLEINETDGCYFFYCEGRDKPDGVDGTIAMITRFVDDAMRVLMTGEKHYIRCPMPNGGYRTSLCDATA